MVLLLIRAQPYDDHELRALLMPEGCEMPCFMGIRPGVTTVDEAVKILERNNWFQAIHVSNSVGSITPSLTIQWEWSQTAPQSLKTKWIKYKPNWIREEGGVIVEIHLGTNFTLADVWLLLGTPTRGGIDFVFDDESPLGGSASNNVYQGIGFRSMGGTSCPVRIDRFWKAPQIFMFFHGDNLMGYHDPEYLNQFLRKIRDVYQVCWGY